jgi:hypothetical protein
MDSSLVQTPVNKNSEFVDRATEIITKLIEQVDKCCPLCNELLKESLQIDK